MNIRQVSRSESGKVRYRDEAHRDKSDVSVLLVRLNFYTFLYSYLLCVSFHFHHLGSHELVNFSEPQSPDLTIKKTSYLL